MKINVTFGINIFNFTKKRCNNIFLFILVLTISLATTVEFSEKYFLQPLDCLGVVYADTPLRASWRKEKRKQHQQKNKQSQKNKKQKKKTKTKHSVRWTERGNFRDIWKSIYLSIYLSHPVYDNKVYLMERLQFWSFEESRVYLYYHNYPDHASPEW